MTIGFVVNDVMTEETGYTTTRLAMAALNRGHESWVIGAGDFAYDADESVHARATAPPSSCSNAASVAAPAGGRTVSGSSTQITANQRRSK